MAPKSQKTQKTTPTHQKPPSTPVQHKQPHPSIIAHFSHFVKQIVRQTKNFIIENPIHTLVGFAIVSAAAIIIFSVASLYLNNPYRGQQATITNLSDYTTGKPTDSATLEYIKYDLYRAISYNTDLDPSTLTDIRIRENSFTQTDDKESGLHTVTFLVDIPSLTQTYRVSYQWLTGSAPTADLDEYGTAVTCPDPADLIFSDFACRDQFTTLATPADPASALLPYTSELFQISLINPTADLSSLPENTELLTLDQTSDTFTNSTSSNSTSENSVPNSNPTTPESTTNSTNLNLSDLTAPLDPTKPTLLITLLLYSYQTNYDDRLATASAQKSAPLLWLTSKNLNPDDYNLIFALEFN